MRRFNRMSVVLLALAPVLMTGWAGVGFGEDFEIEVLRCPVKLITGVVAEVRAEVKNVSGHPITVPWQGQDLQIEVLREDGSWVAPCWELHFNDLIEAPPADWKGKVLERGWNTERRNRLCFELPGEYTVRFFMEAHGPYRNRNGEEYQAWEGEVSTRPMTIIVRAPEGVDLEVFEAYDGDLSVSILGGERPGEILRSFPTSTYAAYVVWETFVYGIDRVSVERLVRGLERPITRINNDVPCDRQVCGPGGWMYLSGRECVDWRDRWFEIVLEHHPRIWFADQVQIRLALDRYLLGDHDAAIAGLESLAEHGGALAAKKCRELLAAMKAKGMLEGGLPTEEGPEAANTE